LFSKGDLATSWIIAEKISEPTHGGGVDDHSRVDRLTIAHSDYESDRPKFHKLDKLLEVLDSQQANPEMWWLNGYRPEIKYTRMAVESRQVGQVVKKA
jgi:hypothetical protein